MKTVIFYKKPGCVTNAKQKQMLRESGCIVIERNILNNEMSKEELALFFKDKSIDECINPNAPQIKNNELDLSKVSKESILELMINEPILIKRPLMIINNKKICGFNDLEIEDLLHIKLKKSISPDCSVTKKIEICKT